MRMGRQRFLNLLPQHHFFPKCLFVSSVQFIDVRVSNWAGERGPGLHLSHKQEFDKWTLAGGRNTGSQGWINHDTFLCYWQDIIPVVGNVVLPNIAISQSMREGAWLQYWKRSPELEAFVSIPKALSCFSPQREPWCMCSFSHIENRQLLQKRF